MPEVRGVATSWKTILQTASLRPAYPDDGEITARVAGKIAGAKLEPGRTTPMTAEWQSQLDGEQLRDFEAETQ